MSLPQDYEQRVYAGVLGKIIGVYLGRPFEGWDHDKIIRELGEIWYYVHEQRKVPLVVTDDDLSGTFTFIRALADYNHDRDLTPRQIGQTWLNYIIENKSILWWGGMGMSTEHTAFLRLKEGVHAPESGSMALNGKVVAEQIGAQIFIDGWGMVAPGDPERAAAFAARAGSVSHDGEAIFGAQVVAALVAQAFVEPDLNRLLDTAVGFIPADSIVYRMIAELRDLRAKDNANDWHKSYELLKASYGYDKYGGICHMIPNHGLIIASLLWGDDSFQKSQMIVNTLGWDTDCNAGNVGCILGVKNGLAGLDAGADFRTPVADQIYVSSADGGRAISDALTESYHLINMARALKGLEPRRPKRGARFHFSQPGAVQGFSVEDSAESRGTAVLTNPTGDDLQIHYHGVARGRSCRVATPTFILPKQNTTHGYHLLASPTIYSGQTVHADLALDDPRVRARLFLSVYDERDELTRVYGPQLNSGANQWIVPATAGQPIAQIGIEIACATGRAGGVMSLKSLTWTGAPDVAFCKPAGGTMWQRAWVDSGHANWWGEDTCRFVSNEGTSLLMQGTREWCDYRVTAEICPHMVRSAGLAARVQGLKRYYALILAPDARLQLLRVLNGTRVLAETSFDWQYGGRYALELEVAGDRICGRVNGEVKLEVRDDERVLTGGAIALVCEDGRLNVGTVSVRPAEG